MGIVLGIWSAWFPGTYWKPFGAAFGVLQPGIVSAVSVKEEKEGNDLVKQIKHVIVALEIVSHVNCML